MVISKIALPRRTFLRGMGVAIALPFIDAMVPALTPVAKAASPVPMRIAQGRAISASEKPRQIAPSKATISQRTGLITLTDCIQPGMKARARKAYVATREKEESSRVP